MNEVVFSIVLIYSIALAAAVMLGKASKDEPLKKPPIDEWEEIYTNPKYEGKVWQK